MAARTLCRRVGGQRSLWRDGPVAWQQGFCSAADEGPPAPSGRGRSIVIPTPAPVSDVYACTHCSLNEIRLETRVCVKHVASLCYTLILLS